MTLAEYGIETTVDRMAKKDRIKQWIQNSIIEEESEETREPNNCTNATDRKLLENQVKRNESATATPTISRPTSTSR